MKVTTVKPSGTASTINGLLDGLIFAWLPYGTYRRSAMIDFGGRSVETSEEIIGAFNEWLDNELSNSLKLGIICRRSSSIRFVFTPNPDRTESCVSLELAMLEDKIVLLETIGKKGHRTIYSSNCLTTRAYAEYADPEMFNIVRAALARVYNGN